MSVVSAIFQNQIKKKKSNKKGKAHKTHISASLVTVALIWPWPSMKVTVQCIFWSTLPQSTIEPNVVTIGLIVLAKHANLAFLTFDWHCDLRVKVTVQTNVLKHPATRYHCAKFGDCSWNSFWEKLQCCFFFYLWPWSFLPWHWVTFIVKSLFWSTLPQSTIVPNLVTVALK